MLRSSASPHLAPGSGPARARLAVALLFAVNGAALGAWLPRIPELQGLLGLSEGQLGLVLVGLPAGALLASVAVGPVLAARGSRGATAGTALVLPLALALVPFAGTPVVLAGALALLGVLEGAMDAAMNTHAVAVQRRYGRSIVNGFHACWSLGALLGAVGSSAAAGAGIGARALLPAVAVLLAAAAAVALPGLLPGAEDRGPPRSAAAGGGRRQAGPLGLGAMAALGARLRRAARAVGAVGVLLVVAGLLGILESLPADWAAVHLAGTLGAPEGVAGLGFVAYAAVQLVGRLAGDPVVRRLGTVRTSRAGALLAGAGLALAAVAGSWGVAALGFALVGLGLATVVPAMFVAAGDLSGVASGQGIAWAAVAARSGTIVAPPVVGGVAELAGLRTSLALAALAALALVGLASALAPAERTAVPADGPP